MYFDNFYISFDRLHNQTNIFLNEINILYKSYQNTREELIKEFQNKSYEISLQPYFCNDIKNHILSFIY